MPTATVRNERITPHGIEHARIPVCRILIVSSCVVDFTPWARSFSAAELARYSRTKLSVTLPRIMNRMIAVSIQSPRTAEVIVATSRMRRIGLMNWRRQVPVLSPGCGLGTDRGRSTPSCSRPAALPKAQFNALMADPKALADVPRARIVEGYYPFGRGHVDRTTANMQRSNSCF